MASFGLGMCMITNTAGGMSGVERREAGLASGLLNSARQCGGSIGEVLVLHDGRTVEAGPAAEVLTRPAQPYTAALLAAAAR